MDTPPPEVDLETVAISKVAHTLCMLETHVGNFFTHNAGSTLPALPAFRTAMADG